MHAGRSPPRCGRRGWITPEMPISSPSNPVPTASARVRAEMPAAHPAQRLGLSVRGGVTRWGRARLGFLLLAAVTAALATCRNAPSVLRVTGKPNILLIFVDDLGYNDVSYNGAEHINTPNIDRLADTGVTFAQGYVNHPFCGPSRAGLMTGRYPSRFGMEWNLAYAPFDTEHGLPVDETVFAATLQQTGYRTGLVGKWQLGAAYPFHPLNRGFDEFFGFLGGSHDYFEMDLTQKDEFNEKLPLHEGTGFAAFEGYLTDALTDRAIDFITAARREPFFLYLAYNAPHTPLQAPRSSLLKFRSVRDRNRRAYLAMVDALDQNIGRVLDALRDSGQRDNTLVFFLSDNGGVAGDGQTWADNRPLRGGKESFYEGGIRVPFLASWPARWPQGAIYAEPVISLDIAATALAVAGAAANPERSLHGINLDPLIRGAEVADARPLFWRQWSPDRIYWTMFAIRLGDLKLVKSAPDAEPSLFNLRDDPGETRDLWPDDPATGERLLAVWNEWDRENPGVLYPAALDYEQSLAQFRADMVSDARAREANMPALRGFARGVNRKICLNKTVIPHEAVSLGLVEDCGNLWQIRAIWLAAQSLHWSAKASIYHWEGLVFASPTGRVQELHLSRRGLVGPVPPALGNMHALQTIALAGNALYGPIPPQLGQLSRLRELRLDHNRLTSIPPELGRMPNLQVIRLAGNPLEGCIPAGLRLIDHDLDEFALEDCPAP